MTALRRRMIEDMRLRGLLPGTQTAYVGAVRALAEYYGKPPDQLSDEELRQYFVYLTDERQVARSTRRVALSGIKFLYTYTLKREWPLGDLVRARKSHHVPVVLSVEEVQTILSSVYQPHHRLCLSLIYACGLRISEGVSVQVSHIDSSRMQLVIRSGKGDKDRYVPLSEALVVELRQFWLTHRHAVYLFPKRNRSRIDPAATGPMTARSVRDAFRAACETSGVTKAATVHTLRHAWATHLLEAGVPLPIIQQWLGHSSPRTTARYTHFTRQAEAQALDKLGELLAGLL